MQTCGKCAGVMAEGFVTDLAYGQTEIAKWSAGEPRRHRWLGVDFGISKPKQRDMLAITVWRCERCGFLEHYAPAPADRPA